MANSTNMERLDLDSDTWRGLSVILRNKLKGFTPSRIIITKEPGTKIYTITCIGPRSMPRRKIFMLFPDGSVSQSPMSD